jgi:HAD superfamily hydrolase (TIGR01490 family)
MDMRTLFVLAREAMRQKIAIYDMDRTVTRRPTYPPFLRYAALRLAPWRLLLLPAVALVTLAYGLKLIDRARLKEINFHLLIGRPTAAALGRVVERFADRQVETNILSGARARLAADKAEGRRLVLATASYKLYAAAIARRLGFDDVIATDNLADPSGRITATIDGDNCYGLAKLDMIEAWLAREGLAREAVHIRFYSDHISDSPAHRWADEAFATNAHARLIRLAEAEGWEVLDWRDRRRAARRT